MPRRAFILLLLLPLAGCLNIGPQTIVQDRFKYNQAIRDSWEEQMLTNVISIRYGESPVFLTVNSVIAQYGLETRATLGGSTSSGVLGSDTIRGDAGATWSERPTITYAPVEGRDFARNLLTPIKPSELFALIESGSNAESSLRLLVKSINGLTAYDPATRQLNPQFFRVLRAFRVLQQEKALGIRRDMQGQDVVTYLYLRDVPANPIIEEAVLTLVDGLNLGRERGPGIEVVFGSHFVDERTIAVQTMSVLDILTEASAFVLVPDQHVAEGRTVANRTVADGDTLSRPLLRVHSSESRPGDALVAVRSRDYWFYIDDRDIDSKNAFAFLMVIMQLTAAQQESKGPTVTIGTGL